MLIVLICLCSNSFFVFQQDQYENVSQHTQKGLDFLERYGHFLRDRASIEVEYAGKLRYLQKYIKNIFLTYKNTEISLYSELSSNMHLTCKVYFVAAQVLDRMPDIYVLGGVFLFNHIKNACWVIKLMF